MDRHHLITHQAFDVPILADGVDVTSRSPIVSVRYASDGSGTRTLGDGRTVAGSWRFVNPEQTQIVVVGPEGSSRRVIVELNAQVCRKVNVDRGIEFIHRPRALGA